MLCKLTKTSPKKPKKVACPKALANRPSPHACKHSLTLKIAEMASLLLSATRSLPGWSDHQSTAQSHVLLTPKPRCRSLHHQFKPPKASNTSSSGGSTHPGPARPQPNSANADISPARLLHTLEFTAIAIAAVGQAAILVSTAVCQWRQTQQLAELQDQLTAVEGSLLEAGSVFVEATGEVQQQRQAPQQQLPAMQVQAHAMPVVMPAHTSLHLITGSALVVGLLCGAGLRQLQARCARRPPRPARLVSPAA